jgi:RNA polymerase sigma-70 factor (ECF subfamily)
MVASCSAASTFPVSERVSQVRFLVDAEAAFRDALTDSLDGLELCDRNMLRFHHFHGLSVDQLADMFCTQRAAVVRQLARIRERVLRDTRRSLAARLQVDKHQLEHLIDLARSRLDLAITRVLRT